MAIRTYGDGRGAKVQLTACPFCGHEFDGRPGNERAAHFRTCPDAPREVRHE